LHISIEQQVSKEHTPPLVHMTRSRVTGDDDLRSDLRTAETRKLRMEKKVQKEVSPPQKMSQNVLRKKKQNQKKKKKKHDAGVQLDKNGFPIYDESLFSSFDPTEWLDAEQDWCVGPAYCTNYGGRVTPFAPEWRRELPDATKSLELRSAIFQYKDEVEYQRYMSCAPKSFLQFLAILSFIHFF
jgi:regulator of replication initiation timing